MLRPTLLQDEGGATMVEYAFMLMLIALVCIIAVQAVGINLNTFFERVADAL